MQVFKIISIILIIFIIGFCILLFCTGCSINKLPISYGCPKIILPDDPVTPLIDIDNDSNADDVIKAWVITAYAYKEWNIIVRKQIEEING